RDALATLEPPPDEIVVSTHPQQRSGWLRKNVVQQIEDAAKGVPVEHVVVALGGGGGGDDNIPVVANETVVGEPLLQRIRDRAAKGPASFLIVSPQSDDARDHPQDESPLRTATTRGGPPRPSAACAAR